MMIFVVIYIYVLYILTVNSSGTDIKMANKNVSE